MIKSFGIHFDEHLFSVDLGLATVSANVDKDCNGDFMTVTVAWEDGTIYHMRRVGAGEMDAVHFVKRVLLPLLQIAMDLQEEVESNGDWEVISRALFGARDAGGGRRQEEVFSIEADDLRLRVLESPSSGIKLLPKVYLFVLGIKAVDGKIPAALCSGRRIFRMPLTPIWGTLSPDGYREVFFHVKVRNGQSVHEIARRIINSAKSFVYGG